MFYGRRLRRIEGRLDVALDYLDWLTNYVINRGDMEMKTWEDVVALVTKQTTVTAGAIAYINETLEKLAELAAKPECEGPAAEEITKVHDAIKENTENLAAAMVKNTPAEPLEVPAMVPGQPNTVYPDGVEIAPFPAPESDPDMSTPVPQGEDPVKPE